jgi:hypothetical protein
MTHHVHSDCRVRTPIERRASTEEQLLAVRRGQVEACIDLCERVGALQRKGVTVPEDLIEGIECEAMKLLALPQKATA